MCTFLQGVSQRSFDYNFTPTDGEWDWDNYSVVYLTQKKDLPVTAMASVKFNVWCAIGNSIHVVHSHLLKMEVCCVHMSVDFK